MRDKDHLRSTLLGQYDFTSKIVIFPARHNTLDAVPYTQLHEESHLKAVSSTVTGAIQSILAFIIRLPPEEVSEAIHQHATELLDATIRNSWFAHEGFAVVRERDLGRLYEVASPISALDPDYNHALALYDTAIAFGGTVLWPRVFLASCVMEACLNTPILREVTVADLIQGDALVRSLEIEGNQPDTRLRAIAPALDTRLTGVLDRTVRRSVAAGLMPPSASPELVEAQFVALLRDQGNRDHLRWDEFRSILDEEFGAELRASNFPHEYLRPVDVQVLLARFYAEVAELMKERHNVTMPQFKTAGYFQTSVATDSVEHGPSQFSSVYGIVPENAADAIDQLLKEDLWFGVHVLSTASDRATLVPSALSVAVFTEAAVPIQSMGQRPSLALRYTKERVLFVGEVQHLREVAERLESRTVVRSVTGPQRSGDKWVTPHYVSTIFQNRAHPVISLLPTTVSDHVLAFLRMARVDGVKRVIVVRGNERVTYMLMTLTTGAHVLLKPSGVLIRLIRDFEPELWSWIVSNRSGEEDGARLAFASLARLLALLDDAGAFVSESADELTM